MRCGPRVGTMHGWSENMPALPSLCLFMFVQGVQLQVNPMMATAGEGGLGTLGSSMSPFGPRRPLTQQEGALMKKRRKKQVGDATQLEHSAGESRTAFTPAKTALRGARV